MIAAVQNERISTQSGPQTLGRRFAVFASWALIGAVVSRGLTLASSVAAGRLLGAAGFGELGMILSTQGMFGILAGAGMGLAATKFVAEHRTNDRSKAERYVGFSLFVAIASSAALAPLMLLASGWICDYVLRAPHLRAELQVATGLLVFGTINGVQSGAIAGMEDFRALAMLNIVRGAAVCVLSLLGVIYWGLMGGVVGLVIAEIVAVLANHRILLSLFPGLRPCRPKDESSWHEFAAMCRFSLLSLSGSVCFTLVLWFANVRLVSEPEGYAALGVFNAADRWRQMLLFLPASISPLLLSMLSNLHGTNHPDDYRRLVGLNLWISVGVVLIPSAIVAVASPWGMLVFGAEYQAGWKTLAVLSLSSIAVVMNTVLGQILVSRGGIGSRFVLDVLLSVVFAATSWLLIPPFRDLGLAISSLIAYSVTALMLGWCIAPGLKKASAPEASP